MKSWALAVALVVACQSMVRAADEKDGFAFPPDKGGQLLGVLLTPGDRPRLITAQSGRKAFPPLRSLELAEVPPSPSLAPVVPLPSPPPAALRPGHAVEESPLTGARGQPVPPQSQTLATGLLTRTPSPPSDQPVAVPVLARPVADRVTLDDPTRDASLEAALAAVPPSRPGPAPFLKPALTDPFENRETVKVRTPPAELTLPVTTVPRPPKP